MVLLSRDAGGAVRARRLAVPVVHTGAGPRAGTPWPLPPSSVAQVPVADLLPHLPVDDPGLAAQARLALVAAGWRDVVVEQVSLAVDAWPHVVRFRGTTAGGDVEQRTVWLRRHLGDLVVAGLPAPGADEPDRGGQDGR